jgi:hypothetical protein
MELGIGILGTVLDGAGDVVEGFCDDVGLPEPVGDLAGGATEMATGHYGDALDSTGDLLSDADDDRVVAQPAAAAPEAPAAKAASKPEDFSNTVEQDLADIQAGKKPKWMDEKEWAMHELQMKEQRYARMVTLLTQLMTMAHETQMAIIRNIKS